VTTCFFLIIKKKMTLVLVHGYNIHADDWDKIVLTGPNWTYGRLPIGLATAINHDADVIMLGSGGTTKDGVTEAQYTKNHIDFLLIDHVLRSHCKSGEADTINKNQLMDKIVLDETSKNTREEVENAFRYMEEHNMHTLYFVSSPAHMPRCMREVCDVFQRRGLHEMWNVFGVPSETTWADPKRVVICEPEHRPGMRCVDWTPLNNLFKMDVDELIDFLSRLS